MSIASCARHKHGLQVLCLEFLRNIREAFRGCRTERSKPLSQRFATDIETHLVTLAATLAAERKRRSSQHAFNFVRVWPIFLNDSSCGCSDARATFSDIPTHKFSERPWLPYAPCKVHIPLHSRPDDGLWHIEMVR